MSDTLAPLAERQAIADRLRQIAQDHGEHTAYMLSYDADFLIETANRIAPTEPAEKIACPHWSPGTITMRNGCTACAATPPKEATK